MLARHIKNAINRGLGHFGYRAVRADNMPLGSLTAFCRGIAARGFTPRTVLDVGANRGDWSREVRAVFPQAKFILIEPQAELGPALDAFCASAPGSRWIAAGAGAQPGELKFTVCPDTVSSSFAIPAEQAAREGLRQRSVPVVTLDDVCREAGVVPEMVKLDVEGFEAEVLKGAGTLIGRTELFLVEATFGNPRPGAPNFLEIVSLMARYGYQAYDFTNFQHRPHDGALGLCEMAFALEQGQLRRDLRWR